MMKQEDETIKVAQIIGKWIGGGVESIVMNYYKNIDHNKIQFDFFAMKILLIYHIKKLNS